MQPSIKAGTSNGVSMKLKKRVAALRTIVIGGLVAVLIFFGARRVNELAADPVGEKECPPLQPSAAGDPARAIRIEGALPANTLPWLQQGGTINDASCLNKTPVYGIVQVTNEAQIQEALAFAREHGLKLSVAGVRHSMGGQAFYQNALVLDMTRFNEMSLDEENKVLTVQSGATWHDIQNFLHPKYAVKAMQSTDIFTVGGSVSVNAHGMDHQVGAIGKTIRSLRILLTDGTVQTVSRTQNPELFDLVVGGYGLFGIILDVELEITENVIYTPGRRVISYEVFPAIFEQELAADPRLGLFYGHLSTAPQSFLREMILYSYTETPVDDPVIPPLGEVSSTKLRRFVLNFSKQGDLPMRLKWFAEKHIEPRLESCSVTRAQAQGEGEACLVSRNEPMHDSVTYLKNNLPGDTDILQEYFIPRAQFVPYIDGLREILTANDTNLLNASVRVVHPEENVLNYAPTEMFAVVLYINQGTTPADNEQMRKVTGEIIDLTLRVGGTFFLPYQLYYTPEQLQQAYPTVAEFFAAKRRYDPELILTNTFYERYAPSFASE
jgi:FAD/FMN-containing dehydrogenase